MFKSLFDNGSRGDRDTIVRDQLDFEHLFRTEALISLILNEVGNSADVCC